MRVKVVSIQSATDFIDGDERITLRFEDADSGFSRVRVRRGVADWTQGLKLNDEIDLVSLTAEAVGSEDSISRAQAAMGELKAKTRRHGS